MSLQISLILAPWYTQFSLLYIRKHTPHTHGRLGVVHPWVCSGTVHLVLHYGYCWARIYL